MDAVTIILILEKTRAVDLALLLLTVVFGMLLKLSAPQYSQRVVCTLQVPSGSFLPPTVLSVLFLSGLSDVMLSLRLRPSSDKDL